MQPQSLSDRMFDMFLPVIRAVAYVVGYVFGVCLKVAGLTPFGRRVVHWLNAKAGATPTIHPRGNGHWRA